MKFRTLLCFAGMLGPLAGFAQVVVTSGYSTGTATVYNTYGVSTSGTVAITGTANITFASDTRVTLAAGFSVATNALFRATIGGDTDGDGLPNAWEILYGLSPTNSSDAQNTSSGSLTYLLEYRLGTTPTTTKQNDMGNTATLKVHRPQ